MVLMVQDIVAPNFSLFRNGGFDFFSLYPHFSSGLALHIIDISRQGNCTLDSCG